MDPFNYSVGNGVWQKYGRNHARQCVCSGCSADYYRHCVNGTCTCSSCETHRSYAFINYPLELKKMDHALANRIHPADIDISKFDFGPDVGKAPAPKVHRHSSKCAWGNDCAQGNAERENKMAHLSMCERHDCGSLGTGKVMGTIVLIPVNAADQERVYADAVHTTGRNTIRLEICPGCVGDFMDLIESNPKTDRQKAYQKPWEPDRAATVAEMLSKMDSQTLMRLAIEKSEREAGLTDDDA